MSQASSCRPAREADRAEHQQPDARGIGVRRGAAEDADAEAAFEQQLDVDERHVLPALEAAAQLGGEERAVGACGEGATPSCNRASRAFAFARTTRRSRRRAPRTRSRDPLRVAQRRLQAPPAAPSAVTRSSPAAAGAASRTRANARTMGRT